MCLWCTVNYAQCFKCNTLFCCSCGESILKVDHGIGEEELYKCMIKYEEHYINHKKSCKDENYDDEKCYECSKK
jgi:hypothetical protein